MNTAKPKSIKITGFVVAVVAALLLLGNMLGFTLVHYQARGISNSNEALFDFDTIAYAKPVAVITVALSLALLVAGINLARYKNWARILAQTVAVLFIIHIWVQAFFAANTNPLKEDALLPWYFVNAAIWSVPFGWLLYYLAQEKVKRYFI